MRFSLFLASLAAVQGKKVNRYVDYLAAGVPCRGFLSFDDDVCTSESKCPAVVLIQDWNGMNEYEMSRACMVADWGYVAFAADIYGVDTPTEGMQDWIAASSLHRNDATMYMGKVHGAISKVMEWDFVNTDNMAATGYCFGGTGVINIATGGHNAVPQYSFPMGLKGVVSYHGGLSSGYAAPMNGTRPKLLLHSGGKDDSNADIAKLTDDLESVGATFEISRYGPNVMHSFTEWSAYAPGFAAYDPIADERSWTATRHFLDELFSTGVAPQGAPDGLPMGLVESDESYVADGVECLGYMVYDASKCTRETPCPGVVVVQDWNGMNEYEKQRAQMLAAQGYVAFAADIYGINTPKETMQDWMSAAGAHHSNATMYMGKISGAFAHLLKSDVADADNLAAMGYCFGGTGMINVAMVGHAGLDGHAFPPGLKGVVSFHGGMTSGYAAAQAGTRPKLLLHSGAKDDSNEDVSTLVDNLESAGASYEITRYGSGVIHTFTEWTANSVWGRYDARADFRSWADTMDFFMELFSGQAPGSEAPETGMCMPHDAPEGKRCVRIPKWQAEKYRAKSCSQ